MPFPRTTRREVIALAAGVALLPRLAAAEETDLGAIAAKRGIAFGSMAEPRSVLDDAASAALIARQSTLITDAQFHWRGTTPSPDSENLTNAERVLAWAEMRKLPVRGHAILWYLQTPEWWASMQDRGAARDAMLRHVAKLARNYRGRVAGWDVVNEPIRVDDGRDDGLRDGPFLRQVGADYIDLAFRAAREADPAARLAFNDYGMELETRAALRKRAAFLKLLDTLKRKGTPVTAVGVQSHLTSGLANFDDGRFRAFLKDVAAHDVDIVLSEMDVVDRDAPADISARDQAVADTYKRYLDVALDEPRVNQVVIWGITDRYNWIADLSLQVFRRPDGQRPRPALFDKDLKPKPAVAAVAAALSAAPQRARGGT
jgi:endo-1,4-beta-xylanase